MNDVSWLHVSIRPEFFSQEVQIRFKDPSQLFEVLLGWEFIQLLKVITLLSPSASLPISRQYIHMESEEKGMGVPNFSSGKKCWLIAKLYYCTVQTSPEVSLLLYDILLLQ